jgi:hypothetical protein
MLSKNAVDDLLPTVLFFFKSLRREKIHPEAMLYIRVWRIDQITGC